MEDRVTLMIGGKERLLKLNHGGLRAAEKVQYKSNGDYAGPLGSTIMGLYGLLVGGEIHQHAFEAGPVPSLKAEQVEGWLAPLGLDELKAINDKVALLHAAAEKTADPPAPEATPSTGTISQPSADTTSG